MHFSSNPDTMTTSERARELAAILAAGYRRLLAERESERRLGRATQVRRIVPTADPIRLGCAGTQSD